ncbi:hypothetical protein ABN034_23455 [Actinopolymorpha sp. B11F2]|uniref:hypothetical protein n=1 Tax=Actinopolymorpha sp. B11F2 TaxID=3160862 RepID=UPI0032E4E440
MDEWYAGVGHLPTAHMSAPALLRGAVARAHGAPRRGAVARAHGAPRRGASARAGLRLLGDPQLGPALLDRWVHALLAYRP